MGSRRSSGQKKLVTTCRNNDVTLVMECGSQSLSDTQLELKNKIEEEYNQFMKKLNESISKRGGEVVEKGTHVTVYEIDCSPNFPTSVIQEITPGALSPSLGLIKPTPTSTLLATSKSSVPPLIPNSGVLLQSGTVASSGSTVFTGQPTTYQLVMGPRMGLIVTPSSPAPSSTIQSATNASTQAPGLATARPTAAPRVQVRANLGSVLPQPTKRLVNVTQPPKLTVNSTTPKNTPPIAKVCSQPPPLSTVNTRSKVKLATRTPESSKPSTPELPASTTAPKSIGATTVVDLTDDDGKPAADSREVTFNRYPGRIYPSLVVVARPNIKVKDMTSAMITAERTKLDTKVKGILTNSPTKFTEWLIQQGLVRSEQVCSSHVNVDMTPIKLKLGMYSDVSKFPYSGGYVWISDCCPQKFVSVFCNSIFEGAPHAPTVLLKLMYHWSCQTNVHNIISWVKVDNLYIKNFFTNLRAVCTAAICEKFGKLGGPSKKVEVGVISLGTTSQNGSVRQVKVEVLGVMDPVTKHVRLRAVDPVQNAEKNHKLRFSRILESLEHWVDKRTTIVTDFTVDKATLNELGFHSVIQVQLNSTQNRDNNQAVMEYLKRVVPRMFQNTLSLLSRSIIQQFLDELVWRERWGPISSQAFDNLILHLAEMTKLDTGDTLINRLKSITANPFKSWSFKNWKINCSAPLPGSKKVPVIEDDATAKGLSQKNMALRSKPVGMKTPANAAKNSKTTNSTVDDLAEDISIVPSIDNLPPSITEIDDDNLSVSSNSSRRSRTRGSTNDDRTTANTSNRPWDPQLVLKSLESFYYGTLPSDVVVINKLRKVDLNMKCFTCGHTYNNNILFMKHLAGHAQNEGAFTTDHQCRYCFRNFTTAFDLEDHLGSVHFPNKFNSMCLICGARFRTRGALVTHMQTNHVELELPYQCTICKFRASEHTKLVDHFYEVHDGGEKVQCPFCLKVVAFESSNKVKLTQNVNFYFNHVKRHQKKPIRKCSKCVLTFVNKALLKEHMTKDHNSCVNIPGVIRHQGADLSTVLMPLPSVAPPLTRKGKPAQSFPVPNFSTYKLDNTLIYPDVQPGKCVECKMDATPCTHFTSYMTCMKCMFATCCKAVMSKHVEKFHEPKGKRKTPSKRKILLEKPLYCVCGYSSTDGNAMASHLVHCKRKIAYPNPEKAAQYSVQMQSASFPPLVNLDDVEQDQNDASDKWLRAFAKPPENDESKHKRAPISEKSPPRMLKVLGLVCKESSGAGSDSEPVDKVKLSEKDDVASLKKLDILQTALEISGLQDEAKPSVDDEIMELSDDDTSVNDKSVSEKDVSESNDEAPSENRDDHAEIETNALQATNKSPSNGTEKIFSLSKESNEDEKQLDARKNGMDDSMETENLDSPVEKMDDQDENNTAMDFEENVDSDKINVDSKSSDDVMVVE